MKVLRGVAVSGIVTTLACACLVAPAAAAPTDDARIARGIAQRVDAPALGSDVTVHVRGIDTDGTVAAHDADERQVPASTMKVVTAANALSALGEDHRFVTRVVSDDRPGHITLVGGGDPLLSRSQIAALAQRTAKALRREGATTVTVDVDDFLFPAPTDASGWAPGDRPAFAAAVRPLAIVGEYSNDTVATAWAAFVADLGERGIRARKGARSLADQDAVVVAAVRPNSVREAVRLMLQVSENNVAETLFRHVALARGYPATWSGASAAAGETLRDLGLVTWRLRLEDGSGLSGQDRLTARFLTQLLDVAASDARLRALIDGLPVAGRSGTLTYRFAAPPASCARGDVAAKTGSLTGVSTLAGITRGSDGQWRSFAIMVNRRPASYPSSATSLAIDTIAAVVNGCV